MPDITVSAAIDTFMQAADQSGGRTALGLGSAATQNTSAFDPAGSAAAAQAASDPLGSAATAQAAAIAAAAVDATTKANAAQATAIAVAAADATTKANNAQAAAQAFATAADVTVLANAIAANLGVLKFEVDGKGAVPTVGLKAELQVPYNCTIQSATIVADQAGASCVISVTGATFAAFPTLSPVSAAGQPSLVTAQKSQDSTLTGWNTTLAKGSILQFNLDSAAVGYRFTLFLEIKRTT